MKPDKPGPEPIISDGTARFTVALFLAAIRPGSGLAHLDSPYLRSERTPLD